MKSIDEVKEFLENLTDEELKAIWNEYCERNNYYDNIIYNMYEFDDIMQNETPEGIALKIFYGDFKITDDYFMFDGYNNLKSGYADEFIYFDELADYICRNEDSLNNDELKDFLEEE